MASVTLENVSKAFSGSGGLAVNNISLDVADREFVVLVGPSGCGKSTTLRMIAGLEQPSSGQIVIGGQVVNQTPPKDRDIAMVFQNYALYPHMSVYKNMAFGLQLRYGGWFKRFWMRMTQAADAAEFSRRYAGIPSQVEEVAETLGIGHLLSRMPAQLSGGERQRVALGRAIVRQPAAFLFDEPLSNLDARLRAGMRRELKRLHATLKTTMIYVTHDQIEAMTLGDRIVVMNQGEIQQAGPPLDVYNCPANRFTASFTGSPPMNFLEGELTGPEGEMQFNGKGVSFRLSDELQKKLRQNTGSPSVTCGVRPEHIKLSHQQPAGCVVACKTKVASIEPLGDSAIIYVDVEGGDDLLAMRVEADATPEPGATVGVSFVSSQIHFFDQQTGVSLTAPQVAC